MPYYLTKVTDELKNISKSSRPTFMIDRLSAFVFHQHPLLVAEWFKNIERSMDNPKKIINILLLQPDAKDDINNSAASFILHLCPDKAIKGFIDTLKDENINWTEQHQTWLQNFENNEENDEEMQQDSEDDSSDKLMMKAMVMMKKMKMKFPNKLRKFIIIFKKSYSRSLYVLLSNQIKLPKYQIILDIYNFALVINWKHIGIT